MSSTIRSGILVGVVGVVIGVSSTRARAQINRPKARMTLEQAKRIAGAVYSYTAVEEFDMSVGLEAGGRHSSPRTREEVRHHLNIPEHYGELIHISAAGHNAVLWFRDDLGALRNAIVPDVDAALYRLQGFETSRYKAQWIRN